MKVLITGGYGFIGSHVAERFHKEGDEVFILDNLSSGERSHITFKHRSYNLSVEDPKCEELFLSHKFDIVIHLAAQGNVSKSVLDPTDDAGENNVGLVNMLDLSRKYEVKKFIWASSAAVYGVQDQIPIQENAICSPISPYGISKCNGEVYCNKWEELYGLQTLCFRLSNVYGPRQSSNEDGGVISNMLFQMYTDKSITVHGDGTQTRDFIYVGDVADAIYRSANSYISGVYNLSSNTEHSVNDIVQRLQEMQEDLDIKYEEKRNGDIPRSVLDNALVKRELDWTPIYHLDEGLSKTAAYYQNLATKKQLSATAEAKQIARRPLIRNIKRILPSIENLLAFALTFWLSMSQMNSLYSMFDVKLFYITIMGILYGSRQAILSVILSIGLLVFQKQIEGRDLISLLYDTQFFFHVSIYLFLGLVVGYSIDRKNAQIRQQEQTIQESTEQYEFLESVYTEVREVKDELQQRILTNGDSFGKIYSVIKELENLEPEVVFNSAVNVVKKIMNVQSVAFYSVNENHTFLRLLASSGDVKPSNKSIKVEDYPYFSSLLATGTMYTNKSLDGRIPLMIAPINHKGRIASIVTIDGLPFENFTLYHENLFKVIVDLVASALSKAFIHIEATEQQRYIPGTVMLRRDLFQEIVETKQQAWKQNQTPYLLLQGETDAQNIEQVAMQVSSLLRDTDYISKDDENHLLVLLSNTSKEDAEYVMNRLAQTGISFVDVMEG